MKPKPKARAIRIGIDCPPSLITHIDRSVKQLFTNRAAVVRMIIREYYKAQDIRGSS